MSQFGATIFGCSGLVLSAQERAFFAKVRPFAFILFGRNVETAPQIRSLCKDLRDSVGYDAPILIDQEGGRVQRLRAPLATNFLPPLDHIAQVGADAARVMYLRGRIIAHELRAVGVDANCAPMVDVAHPETHAFLKNRCYGFDAEVVSQLGRAMADGLLQGGVLPVAKHIPGHGRALVDSHHDLPRVTASEHDLEVDFAPFAALNDLPMGMTAHIVYEALDAAPATTSPKMMQLIRDKIGFDGLIMTDDISMQALSGTIADRSVASLAAGCDVVLHCNGNMDEMQSVAEVSGTLSEVGQRRAQEVLAARRTPEAVDIQALSAELKAF